MSKIDLLVETLSADAGDVVQKTDDLFAIGDNQYLVCTKKQAAEYGYTAGERATSDADLFIYRIA